MNIQPIAHIHSDFPTKFGIPRQSGLAEGLMATIVFEPAYRVPEAIRGIEGFSHLWLIWGFSKSIQQDWSPTVRPPRLGGETRMGVFATRSPFRPNGLGLSSVRLLAVEKDVRDGAFLVVDGADLMDGTPIYDIKPYLPYTDCHPASIFGYAREGLSVSLAVVFPDPLLTMIPPDRRDGLIAALRLDPRPAYQHDPQRVYGFNFAGFDVRFRVADGVLTVVEVVRL